MKKFVLVLTLIAVLAASLGLAACDSRNYSIGTKIEDRDEAIAKVDELLAKKNFAYEYTESTNYGTMVAASVMLIDRTDTIALITTSTGGQTNGNTSSVEMQHYYIEKDGKVQDWLYTGDGEFDKTDTGCANVDAYLATVDEFASMKNTAFYYSEEVYWDDQTKTFKFENGNDCIEGEITVYTGGMIIKKQELFTSIEAKFYGYGEVELEEPSVSFFDLLIESMR